MASQGEGSRGGKIIGHTKSGKPIYGERVIGGTAAASIGATVLGSEMRTAGRRNITRALSQAGSLAADSMNYAKGDGKLARSIAAMSGKGPAIKKLAEAGMAQKRFGTKALMVGGALFAAAWAMSSKDSSAIKGRKKGS